METLTINNNITAFTGESQSIDKIFEGRHLNAQMNTETCPNHNKHVSGFPAFDRTLCPVCRKVYVSK